MLESLPARGNLFFSSSTFAFRDEVAPVVEKPRKKSKKKVSKEESTEDQPNPGVRNMNPAFSESPLTIKMSTHTSKDSR